MERGVLLILDAGLIVCIFVFIHIFMISSLSTVFLFVIYLFKLLSINKGCGPVRNPRDVLDSLRRQHTFFFFKYLVKIYFKWEVSHVRVSNKPLYRKIKDIRGWRQVGIQIISCIWTLVCLIKNQDHGKLTDGCFLKLPQMHGLVPNHIWLYNK